jgi:predicted DNA-binding transcriptional regulator AlpA
MSEPATQLLRFADLKARNVVTNWPQLKRLVDNHGFPAGYLLSPAVRVWDASDIEAWLNARRSAARASHTNQVAA